jgi:predicted CoA-substrate-specific enzyme activase
MSKPTGYLGIDLGSSYTKLVVLDEQEQIQYRQVIPTLSRNRRRLPDTLAEIEQRFHLRGTCATGYGRNSFNYDSPLKKTEIICASVGVSHSHPQLKTVMDIGGEDIKIIASGPRGEVVSFFMNDKCSAGTGAFITEIAERVDLDIAEMSTLAAASRSQRELNSFCTVFAKSEILGWLFDGVPLEDIARGIYLSIASRIQKMRYDPSLPIILCGGVIKYHPYLREILGQKLGAEIRVAEQPLYQGAIGAALLALREGKDDG